MKQVYLIMGILGLVSCFTGLSAVMDAVTQRGMAGANYGQVVFPLLLAVFSFWMYKRKA